MGLQNILTAQIPPGHLPPVVQSNAQVAKWLKHKWDCGKMGERRDWPKKEGYGEMPQLQVENRCWGPASLFCYFNTEIFVLPFMHRLFIAPPLHNHCSTSERCKTHLSHLLHPSSMSRISVNKSVNRKIHRYAHTCSEILLWPAICHLNVSIFTRYHNKLWKCRIKHILMAARTRTRPENTVKQNLF